MKKLTLMLILSAGWLVLGSELSAQQIGHPQTQGVVTSRIGLPPAGVPNARTPRAVISNIGDRRVITPPSVTRQDLPTGSQSVVQPVPTMEHPPVLVDPGAWSESCDCERAGCRRCHLGQRLANLHHRCRDCGTDCGCYECPSCECNICQLEVKQGKEEKTCFKVEQAQVCIPPVWLPWRDCPPTTSRTRTINKLKKHKYECPNCSYEWKLVKPETVAAGGQAQSAPAAERPTTAARIQSGLNRLFQR